MKEQVKAMVDNADLYQNEPPRPLRKKAAPPESFPIDDLGEIMGYAALSIQEKIQAPLAICAQSVLAAAALALQPYADVMLPIGQKRPIGNYWLTIAGSGERKTTADNIAIAPFEEREEELNFEYQAAYSRWKNKNDAWEKQRAAVLKNNQLKSVEDKTDALKALGEAPIPPLTPMLICPEPTFEGLCKLYMGGYPTIGLFSSEGGQFIGGHGMSEDNKLKTSTAISGLWDGKSIKRVRAGDGASTLSGKRLSMHLMVQPGVAAKLLSDAQLIDQGLISRFLISAPETTAGTRFHREVSAECESRIRTYHETISAILRMPYPLAEGKNNELAPRTITLTPEAQKMFYGFADHIEKMLKPGGQLEQIVGLANKLPEHAVRLACVVALVENIHLTELDGSHLEAGINLAQYYANEALRLVGEALVPQDIRLAERLLSWLHHSWTLELVSLPDIYQRGLNAIGNQTIARRIVGILEAHGWLVKVPEGGVINGTRRKEVWRIINE